MFENDRLDENIETVVAEAEEIHGTVMEGEALENAYTSYQMDQMKQPAKKEKKKKGFIGKLVTCICLGLAFGLFAGVGFEVVNYVADTYFAEEEEEVVINQVGQDKVVTIAPEGTVPTLVNDVSDVVEDVMPAMVTIVNISTQTTTNFWGQQFTQETPSSGSGIIIAQNDTELLVATNHHVVEDSTRLEVTFIDGSTGNALVKGKDAEMDLAVIAIPLKDLSDETKKSIAIAAMGDSDALRLGQPVIAIGNALGYGQSVTGGYVSALNREIEMNNGAKGTFIQTDAAINFGNSGGALLNIAGEVIGINSSKIGGNAVEGMGYAIPISAAQPIIEELMNREIRVKVEDGKVGYMGVTCLAITDEMAETMGLPKGVFIRDVENGSPAWNAGVRKGDILVKFDGERLKDYDALQEILQYFAEGSVADIVVMRQIDGEYVEKELEITLGKRPQ